MGGLDVIELLRYRQGKPATPEAERAQFAERSLLAGSANRKNLLVEHVATDDSEIADAIGDHVRHVVIADQQQVHGQGLTEAEQLVAAAPEAEPAAGQQIERGVAEAAGFLDGDAQAVASAHAEGLRAAGRLRAAAAREGSPLACASAAR